jgi:hypothetical protein
MTEIDTRTMNASRIRTITTPGIAGIGHGTASTSHTVRRMVATEKLRVLRVSTSHGFTARASLLNGLREAA